MEGEGALHGNLPAVLDGRLSDGGREEFEIGVVDTVEVVNGCRRLRDALPRGRGDMIEHEPRHGKDEKLELKIELIMRYAFFIMHSSLCILHHAF